MTEGARAGEWAAETEQRVLNAALERAVDLGWNGALVGRAAAACGLSAGDAELLFPHGARDLAALLSRRHDAHTLEALPSPDGLKIRERIARAVETRIEIAAADGEAVQRWAIFLASPPNAPLGLKLAWATADELWRWAGDTATDENHYSKRAILAGILIPALSIRLDRGEAASRRFVAARIENVMAFEKWKATRQPLNLGDRLVGALARLRYGGHPGA
jgi:ubiquinone biosynthesis protein COQ9